MAVLDELDMLDAGHDDENDNDSEDSEDFKGSDVEILDGGSDVDIYKETELMKFSRMLRNAQKKAMEEEKAKGNKRKTYSGHSRSTEYRWKCHQSNLYAQGYRSVPAFWTWVC